LDALQHQARAGPTRAVLYEQRRPVCLRVRRRLPQQDAGQRESEAANGPN